MTDSVERAFSMLRRGPWNQDPNALAQERSFSDGQAESQGWLADDSVTADVIQANAVIAGKIDADAVTAREIAANTITATEIAANTITANEIAANTITANEIAANTITAAEIASNAITADEIAANTITAAEIAADAITTNELAANAVITENLLAANVTSSKIELTVTGKNFGANDGTTSAPGIYFDSLSSTGISKAADGGINFTTLAGSITFAIGKTNNNVSYNDLEPSGDNTWNLGNSGKRWIDVWAVNGAIQTSDVRLKTDIEDSPLGLSFIRTLRPVSYRWRETSDTQAREAASVDDRAIADECRPFEDALRDLRAAELRGESISLDAVEEARRAIRSITDRYAEKARDASNKRRPGRRVHLGLVAQEVKAALDASGSDMALWKQSPDGEQSLAYTELIAPLIKAVQELDAKVTELAASQ